MNPNKSIDIGNPIETGFGLTEAIHLAMRIEKWRSFLNSSILKQLCTAGILDFFPPEHTNAETIMLYLGKKSREELIQKDIIDLRFGLSSFRPTQNELLRTELVPKILGHHPGLNKYLLLNNKPILLYFLLQLPQDALVLGVVQELRNELQRDLILVSILDREPYWQKLFSTVIELRKTVVKYLNGTFAKHNQSSLRAKFASFPPGFVISLAGLVSMLENWFNQATADARQLEPMYFRIGITALPINRAYIVRSQLFQGKSALLNTPKFGEDAARIWGEIAPLWESPGFNTEISELLFIDLESFGVDSEANNLIEFTNQLVIPNHCPGTSQTIGLFHSIKHFFRLQISDGKVYFIKR